MWRGDRTLRLFFVYIMSNTSMTLYTGVTNNLHQRSTGHKNGTGSEFTARYHFDRCVYFETYESILEAIAREADQRLDTCEEDRARQDDQSDMARPDPSVTLSRVDGPVEIRCFAQDDGA